MSKNNRKGKNTSSSPSSLIGTRKESSLHRSLKYRYSGEGGSTETMVGEYVCDGITESGEFIEVQNGSFGPLKDKIQEISQKSKVRIIHPIIAQKYIELYDTDGRLIHRRISPQKGKVWNLFNVLIYAPKLPLLKNLTIELAVIDAIEKRVNDGSGSWRRKGVSIADRSLGAWHQSLILKKPRDYYRFIPFEKDEPFTVRNLAEKAELKNALSRKTIYVLEKMNLLERVGKQGKAFVYKRL